MKLRIASDLHTEFHADQGEALLGEVTSGEYDVLVVAGDLSDARNLPRALEILCCGTRGRPIVYVLGNHEFYGASRSAVCDSYDSILKLAEREHPHLKSLDVGVLQDIDGVRFIGAPLWFSEVPGAPVHAMNDFDTIRGFKRWVYRENRMAQEFFEEHLWSAQVVVTHHLPHRQSIARRFEGSPLNAFFLSEVPALKKPNRFGPMLWVHGHTHESVRYELGKIRVVCNPFGYAGHEENPRFDSQLTVEIA